MSIKDTVDHRILVLDGAMGTMIQRANFSENDFRGNEFAEWACNLKGCNDVLCLTQPEEIKKIHKLYLDAGADIIETNSFNSNSVSLFEYNLQDRVYDISFQSARIARKAVEEWQAENGNKEKFVAGSVGPTNKSLSLSPDVENPAMRSIEWNTLSAAYENQIRGLIDGGVDAILIETVFDSLNAKCALWTAEKIFNEKRLRLPLMMSVTLTESGRILSGQTLEAFLASVSHFDLFSVGLNCGFGAEKMLPFVDELAEISPYPISLYPNAGLPNEMGEYDETPEEMLEFLIPLFKKSKVSIIGGCCGTTPTHIKLISDAVKGCLPYIPKAMAHSEKMILSGLDVLEVSKERNFVNVGERCNVAGSRKFLRLINEKKYDEALLIARKQVKNGAQIIDINMDDAMLDSVAEMSFFIKLLSSEPDIAKVPIMIDSSDWKVIESALPLLQGKGIVNSISLKEGEENFCRKAEFINSMGAAVVVMAFDEEGQATTYKRKIEICERAYRILTEKVGFAQNDIIFDPNVLSVATGIEEHNYYAQDFIKSVDWIKNNLPGSKVSGGISNLSFSFRGNNYVREAMHSIFLYHAIKKGMDMAIVNAGNILPYDSIPEELRNGIEKAFFEPSQNATNELVELAQKFIKDKSDNTYEKTEKDQNLNFTPSQKLTDLIVKGLDEDLDLVLDACMKELKSPVKIIDEPLMAGMNMVGNLFGDGKLFLPQVVKSARVMKEAVEWLNPYIEKERGTDVKLSKRVVFATVKGDVHDIGKNIVCVILRCNGFEVFDLGTMVPLDVIIQKAIEVRADFVGLSGLITPSLHEMCCVAKAMDEKGLKIPILVGGATTSALHTAVKIAPCYRGSVIYTRDAAILPTVMKKYLSDKDNFIEDLNKNQQRLRDMYKGESLLISFEHARKNKLKIDWNGYVAPEPKVIDSGIVHLEIDKIRDFINWRPFYIAWKLDPSFADIDEMGSCCQRRAMWLSRQKTCDMPKASQALQLYKEANRAIDYFARVAGDSIVASCKFFKVHSEDENIVFDNDNLTMHFLRQQKDCEVNKSLADFISPNGDYMATFAVTVGEQIKNIIKHRGEIGEEYDSILYQTVADRLVEAATEYFHTKVKQELWGYESADDITEIRGIRPAVGYPCMPDQSMIFDINKLMPLEKLGIEITENGAMSPSSTISGIMISHAKSSYFNIGVIGKDQRADYAKRKGITVEESDKWIVE